jgi:hypothetical protein
VCSFQLAVEMLALAMKFSKTHHTPHGAQPGEHLRSLKAAQDANTHQPDHPHPHTHHPSEEKAGRSRDLERPRSDMQLASGPQKKPPPEPTNGARGEVFSRKEVIQPHLPVRLPCYDFVPIAGPTFDGSPPYGLGHRLRVLPTFMT